MAKIFSERLIISVDVGTTKICVLVAQYLDKDHLEILGLGKAPSEGLRKGVVVDVAKTVQSIKAAVKEAELMSGVTIESAYVGISGGHIHSINSHGVVPIRGGDVRPLDVANALAAARAIPVAEGQQILHVLPQYFVIDGQERIADPVGMFGIRLEVQAHIILGAIASVQTLVRCCEMAGVKVNDIVLEQLASADAVLSEDERQLGIAMLDIGGGTSDLAIYQNGSIRHTMVLPIAGNHFTNDIAIGLRTTLKDAERIKKQYGAVSMDYIGKDEVFEVESVQGNQTHLAQTSELINIIQPRSQELLFLINEEIVKRNLQSFVTAGLVLTGGGSLLKGMQYQAEDIFGIPVRIGSPRLGYKLPELLDNPMYATGYGLLVHAHKRLQNSSIDSLDGPLMKRVFVRMKSWVSDFF